MSERSTLITHFLLISSPGRLDPDNFQTFTSQNLAGAVEYGFTKEGVMHDFDRWLLEEYLRVAGKLAGDRAELARRLARRRTSMLVDPPRAWCLAVRASDTRITPS